MLTFLWFGIARRCPWLFLAAPRVFPVGRPVNLWRVRQARARCHRARIWRRHYQRRGFRRGLFWRY